MLAIRQGIPPRRDVVVMDYPAQLILRHPPLLTRRFPLVDPPFLRETEQLVEVPTQMHAVTGCSNIPCGGIDSSVFEVGVGVAHD